MSQLTLKVHEFKTDPNTHQAKIVGFHPYIRLKGNRDDPPVFVQDGVPFAEGGEPMEYLPDWFAEEARKVNEGSARQVKLDKLLASLDAEAAPADPSAEDEVGQDSDMAECPHCGWQGSRKGLGIHKGIHCPVVGKKAQQSEEA